MHNTIELLPTRHQMMFAAAAGLLFCFLHLLNSWLFSFFEFSNHISLVYLPSFLRLANVLVLGLVWGSAATAIGGFMLMWWFNEPWLIALSNALISACVAALALGIMQLQLNRRLTLRKLSDLIQVAVLYALLNALSHHLMWSILDPQQLIELPQLLYMVIGDLNGALIGALALRWLALHTTMVESVRNLSHSRSHTHSTDSEDKH